MRIIKFIKRYRTSFMSLALVLVMVYSFRVLVWEKLIERDFWNFMTMSSGYFILSGYAIRSIKNMLFGVFEYGLDYLKWDEEEDE